MRIPRDLEALTLVVALVACLIAVPAASATPITYVCGQDLCRVRAPGRSPAHLTHHGDYLAMLNVRDSARVAYQRSASGWWLADHDLRHARQYHGNGLSTDARGFTFILSLGGDELLCLTQFGGHRHCGSGTIGFVEWWRTRVLYGQVDAPGLADFQQRICLLTALVHCARVVARAEGDCCSLREFDVSPDGRRLVAVEDTRDSATPARLVVFDVATGRRVRILTSGHDDHHPSFSPDGRLVVFDRDYNVFDRPVDPIVGDVAVVAVGGGPARVFARGHHPAWTP